MAASVLKLDPLKKNRLDAAFAAAFGGMPERYFSAPGRTEIGGNHTDHQRGRVLAAAVNLDTVAAVRPNGTDFIRVCSAGYAPCEISVRELTPREDERNTTAALIRGVAAGFSRLGCDVGGFDACCESDVLPGSGLSSSAAFEVLIGTVINGLFFEKKATPAEVAQVGRYAENAFFGKPCGLMDQMASAVGNLVGIDFSDKERPEVQSVSFDFSACGHALCIIDSGADHADLTDEYAAIPGEMQAVAACFGREVLSEVDESDFFAAIPAIRSKCGDRAVLRAIHFYQENARVPEQVAALKRGEFDAFLKLVRESGRSSWMYLQNVIPTGSRTQQNVALTLALCSRVLQERGAYRVHGGGFAGTVQAFVPLDLLDSFRSAIDGVLGAGACHILEIRPQGGTEVTVSDGNRG